MADSVVIQTTMDAYQWLHLLGLGGVVGALGQGARTIVGMKKLNDLTSDQDRPWTELLDVSRLITSLAIGFVAGAFAAVSLISDIVHVSAEQIFTLAASGYAGTDFIEGFIQRIPNSSTTTSTATAGGGVSASDNAVG